MKKSDFIDRTFDNNNNSIDDQAARIAAQKAEQHRDNACRAQDNASRKLSEIMQKVPTA